MRLLTAAAVIGLAACATVSAQTVPYLLAPGVPFSAGPTLPTAAPVVATLPVITGSPQVGQTLTTTSGVWANSPTGFAYQWLKAGSPISGATATTYVPVIGDLGTMISVIVTATNGIGSTPATAAAVGPVLPLVPAFVASVCPGLPNTGICADLISSASGGHVIGGQVWDGVAQTTVTPASLMTDTRSTVAPYDPGTSITTSIAINTLPLGSLGLQVFNNNINLALQTVGDYTASPWIKTNFGAVLPTVTKNPNFGGAGCTTDTTAPDGSCNTTEVTFPIMGSNQLSAVEQTVTGLTAGATYTFSIWLKNSAAVTNPQAYLSIRSGATTLELTNKLVQPGLFWENDSVTFTLTTGTSAIIDIGNYTATSLGPKQNNLGGGKMELWVSQLVPGSIRGPYVPTTTAAATTAALDNIVATGNLATALTSSNAALSATVQRSGNGVAGTIVDSNGVVLLGKSATDSVTTALTATLSTAVKGNFPAVEQAYLSWNGSGGSINVNGTKIATDATARTTTAPFHIGTTSGTTAPLNGFITALAVYPASATPSLVASAPITGVTFGTIGNLASGALTTPTIFVNGGSWNPTQDVSSNLWVMSDDTGYIAYSGQPNGNVVLNKPPWTTGTPGFFTLNTTANAINTFNSNLGTYQQAATNNTWKSCGLIAISDGANTDLFSGLSFDTYATAAPWIEAGIAGTIASVDSASAATPASWFGLPPSPAVLPATTPTFNSQQFGSPCFIQYAAGYVNSTLPTPSPDNSGTYLYATSNDGGWNAGSNVYLARIPLATIEVSLGGSLAAASVPANWQFYNSLGCAGGDGMNSACWISALASATPIYTSANKAARSQMTYLPATNRYILGEWYFPLMGGPTKLTQTQAIAVMSSQLQYIDCAKPWLCTGVVSTNDFPIQGYYQPTIVPNSLALDGGFTATALFAGNWALRVFNSNSTMNPTFGQMTIRY